MKLYRRNKKQAIELENEAQKEVIEEKPVDEFLGGEYFPSDEISQDELIDSVDFLESTHNKLNANPSRIGGSLGEKRTARQIRDICSNEIGILSRMESFNTNFWCGKASILLFGIGYAVAFLFYLISFAFDGAVGIAFSFFVGLFALCDFIFAMMSVLGFDFSKKVRTKKTSYNVISFLKPRNASITTDENGDVQSKIGKKLLLVAGYDGKFGNNFDTKPKFMEIGVLCSICSSAMFLIFCLLRTCLGVNNVAKIVTLVVLPTLFVVPAIFFLVSYVSFSKRKIIENNEISVATSLAVLKFLKDECRVPDDSAVGFVAFGSESFGNKGAKAFLDAYKDSELLKGATVLNVSELLNGKMKVVGTDKLRKIENDSHLANLTYDVCTQKDFDIEKYDGIQHSFYGYSSNIFAKAGFKTLTLTAKDTSVNLLKENCEEDIERQTLENNFSLIASVAMAILQEKEPVEKIQKFVANEDVCTNQSEQTTEIAKIENNEKTNSTKSDKEN